MIKVKSDNEEKVILITESNGNNSLSSNSKVESGNNAREYSMSYEMLKVLLWHSLRGLELNIQNHSFDDLGELTERLMARVYHLIHLIDPKVYDKPPRGGALATANMYGLATFKKIMKMSDSIRNNLIEQNKEEEKGFFVDDCYISILGEDISYSLLSMLIKIGCKFMFIDADIESTISAYPITGSVIIYGKQTHGMFFSNLLISNSVKEAMARTIQDTPPFIDEQFIQNQSSVKY